MEKIVGSVISKSTGKSYAVKWISDDKTAWIKPEGPGWLQVCNDVKFASDAVSCAQRYIDGQPDLF